MASSADLVLGQPNFTSNATATTATSLWGPTGVSVDSSGNVWVADQTNNRVLEYTAATIASWVLGTASSADVVLGQPNFTTGTSGFTAITLSSPERVAVDSSGNVWVADRNNNRVLEYTAATIAAWVSGTASSADLVLGQPNFTSNASGTTATTLNLPRGVSVDSSGNVWVADTNNRRTLEYKASTIAAWTSGTAIKRRCGAGPTFNDNRQFLLGGVSPNAL